MGLLNKLNENSAGLIINSLKYLYEHFSRPKKGLVEWLEKIETYSIVEKTFLYF